MDPSSNETGFNAPPPELPAPINTPEAAPSAPERAPAPAEKAPAAGPPQSAALPAVAAPLPLPPMPAAPATDASTTTDNDVSNASADADLIEKEWVDKAKQIVERTREDPYLQSNELTAVKADYLQKRYNKTVKLDG